MIDAVVFDVGETLVDETREYGTWADWLGVPRHTFSAVFGAVIALGMDYRDTFQYFRPGFSLDVERAQRADAGQPEWFGEDDLYPDVRPCLTALRDMGVWVGVAGNQTSRAGEILRKLDLPADLIATSEDWGASKPDSDSSARSFQRHRVRLAGLSTWVTGWIMTLSLPRPLVCGRRLSGVARGVTSGSIILIWRQRRIGAWRRWLSCRLLWPRSTGQSADRGVPVVEPLIEPAYAWPRFPFGEGFADGPDAVHACCVPVAGEVV